jgi:hypothetical protein
MMILAAEKTPVGARRFHLRAAVHHPPAFFNDHAASEARLIVISNRMVKEMGFDWFDQIENALGF